MKTRSLLVVVVARAIANTLVNSEMFCYLMKLFASSLTSRVATTRTTSIAAIAMIDLNSLEALRTPASEVDS